MTYDDTTHRQCTKCKEVKEKADYYFNKKRNREAPQCKSCTRKYSRNYLKNNPDKKTATRKAWMDNSPDRGIEIERERYNSDEEECNEISMKLGEFLR